VTRKKKVKIIDKKSRLVTLFSVVMIDSCELVRSNSKKGLRVLVLVKKQADRKKLKKMVTFVLKIYIILQKHPHGCVFFVENRRMRFTENHLPHFKKEKSR